MDDARKECNYKQFETAAAFYGGGRLHMYPGRYTGKDALLVITDARHEATHQLNDIYAPGGISQWIDEGLATYAEYGAYKKGKLSFGSIGTEEATRQFFDSIQKGTYIKMKALLMTEVGSGYTSLHRGTFLSLIHFFMHSHSGKYRQSFTNYVFYKPQGNIVKTAYGATEKELERDWVKYCKTLKMMDEDYYLLIENLFKSPEEADKIWKLLEKQ
jgi:hypothetical protein